MKAVALSRSIRRQILGFADFDDDKVREWGLYISSSSVQEYNFRLLFLSTPTQIETRTRVSILSRPGLG